MRDKSKINSKEDITDYKIATLGPIPRKLTLTCASVLCVLLFLFITLSLALSSPVDEKDNVLRFILKTMNIL